MNFHDFFQVSYFLWWWLCTILPRQPSASSLRSKYALSVDVLKNECVLYAYRSIHIRNFKHLDGCIVIVMVIRQLKKGESNPWYPQQFEHWLYVILKYLEKKKKHAMSCIKYEDVFHRGPWCLVIDDVWWLLSWCLLCHVVCSVMMSALSWCLLCHYVCSDMMSALSWCLLCHVFCSVVIWCLLCHDVCSVMMSNNISCIMRDLAMLC